MKIPDCFISILPFRLDAIGDVDFSRDGSQSSDSPLHANERSSFQISLPHRIRPPVFLSFGMEFSRLFQVKQSNFLFPQHKTDEIFIVV